VVTWLAVTLALLHIQYNTPRSTIGLIAISTFPNLLLIIVIILRFGVFIKYIVPNLGDLLNRFRLELVELLSGILIASTNNNDDNKA